MEEDENTSKNGYVLGEVVKNKYTGRRMNATIDTKIKCISYV